MPAAARSPRKKAGQSPAPSTTPGKQIQASPITPPSFFVITIVAERGRALPPCGQ
jgi:hypothetical protein